MVISPRLHGEGNLTLCYGVYMTDTQKKLTLLGPLGSAQFYYDPDYRKTHIHPKDPKKPYCCRCQQNVDVNKAIPVTINEETFMAIEGHNRHEEIRTNFNPQSVDLVFNSYLGKDCRKVLARATGKALAATGKEVA